MQNISHNSNPNQSQQLQNISDHANSARSIQSNSNEPVHRLSLSLQVTSLKDLVKPARIVVTAEPCIAWGKVRSSPISVKASGNCAVDLRATGLLNVNKATLQNITVNENLVVNVEEEYGTLIGSLRLSIKSILQAKADTSQMNVRKKISQWMAAESDGRRICSV